MVTWEQRSASGSMAAGRVTQLLLHSYPQLLLVLVGTSLEHSVSYNDGESVPVIMYSLQLRMTCVMCWL